MQDGPQPVLQNLDQRVGRIEQILPTLATKTDLAEAIAPLASKAELAAAIAPLATREGMRAAIAEAVAPLAGREEMKAAIREEAERTRRHFDVVAESLSAKIDLLAEGHHALAESITSLRKEV